MINFIKKIIKEKKLQKSNKIFKEYEFEIKKFQIDKFGEVEYAQWLHPLELPKKISASNILFFQKISQKGGMIVDIGAHTGDTTVPMALAVGKEGIVLGIEPNKYVFKILEKNAKLNRHLTNIVPMCFAATSEDGEFTFNYCDASFCNGGFLSQVTTQEHHHNYTLDVVGKNLQNLLLNSYKNELERISLIKIDVEGYDKEILKTIPVILNRYKPALIVECSNHLNQEQREELFDIISNHGYLLFYLENFELFDELKELKRQDMMNKSYFDLLAIHESKGQEYQW